MGSASSKQDGHSRRKLVLALTNKRMQQRRQQPTSKNRVQEVLPVAGLPGLPSEVVEIILTYVWHGPGIAALPGNGQFQPIYHDPTPIDVPQYISQDAYSALQTTAGSIHPDIGLYPRLEIYRRLSLVHSSWHIAMQRIALSYVSLTDLGAIERYTKVINWQGSTGNDESYDQSPQLLTPSQQRSRLLCWTLHAHFATGNLTLVPSWSAVAQLLPNLPSLTHLIITAAEAHPALGGLLASLPPTVRELEIYISSVYKYKMPLKEIPLDAVKNITHLLLSAYDVKFLQKALEPFTPPVVPSANPQAPLPESGSATPPDIEAPPVIMHPHVSLHTLSLVGPHCLTDPWFEATSHSTGIKIVKLYELDAPGRAVPTSDAWALADALNHAPWLPKLERVYVQRGLASGLRDEEIWGHIVTACGKRGVHLLSASR